MSKVLILCPTYNHVDTLFASIASVRMQTFREWEMVVIGDGAPDRTFEIVAAFAAGDPRISAEPHPKGERRGEAYRDPVIRRSDAEFVCHLNDDNLWAPRHLAEMVALLEKAEFVTQCSLMLSPDGSCEWRPYNPGTLPCRDSQRRKLGINTGIDLVAYRRDTYLRLDEGWAPAPPTETFSDQYMWGKFLRLPGLSVAGTAQATAIGLPSAGQMLNLTPVERLASRMPLFARLSDPDFAPSLRRSASVATRMAQMFAIHGGEQCGTVEEAYAAAGLVPVDADVPPEPAVNGAPMVVPLTDAQRREGWLGWAMLRAYATTECDSERAAVRDALGHNVRAWRKAIRRLMRDRPDAAIPAAADFATACPGAEAPQRLAQTARERIGAGWTPYQPVAFPNE